MKLQLEVIVKKTRRNVEVFTKCGVNITNSFNWLELQNLARKNEKMNQVLVNGEVYNILEVK